MGNPDQTRLGSRALSLVAVTACCTMLAFLPVSIAAGARVAAAKSPLKQGLAFYAGKTITYIVPTSAGAQYDLETRDLLPYLDQYLHATVNVVNIAAGASIPGQDQLAAAPPDGLTIGMLELGTDMSNLIQNLPGLNFNPAHEAMLGGPESSTSMIITSANSPYTSLQSLQSASAATPARLLLQTTSSSNIQVKLLLRIFGIHTNIIYGYANSTAIITGFQRGDGNMVFQSVTATAPLVQGGIAHAIVQSVIPPTASPYYALLRGVPTFTQAEKKYALQTPGAKRALSIFKTWQEMNTITIAAPARTPNDEVVALRAAVAFAMKQPALTAEYVQQGNPVGFVDGPTNKAGYLNGEKLVKPIQSLLGL